MGEHEHPSGNRYLSGNGDNPLRAVADHTLLLLAARAMAVVGVPVAGFLFWQVWDGLESIKARVASTDVRSAVHTEQIIQHERRITDHDRRLGRLEWGRRSDDVN